MDPRRNELRPAPMRPRASWVMGRSARWHSPAGQELLAEVPDDGELGWRATALEARSLTGPPSLGDAVAFAVLLSRMVRRVLDRRR